jgi:hypothetical protein
MSDLKHCGFCRFSTADGAEFDRHLYDQHGFVAKAKQIPEGAIRASAREPCRLVNVPMTPDVLKLVQTARQRGLVIWSIAAVLAALLAVGLYVLVPVFDKEISYSDSDALGLTMIVLIVLSVVSLVTLRGLRANTRVALDSKRVTWAIGTFDLYEESTGEGERDCTLIAGVAKVRIKGAVFDQVRRCAPVTTTEKHFWSGDDHKLTFTGAAQFVPNVKLLRIISSGSLVYEHPGLAPDSGVPPS